MSPITTHVLDTAEGHPAKGVPINLAISIDGAWKLLGRGETNEDGRVANLLPEDHKLVPGTYRIVFDTQTYFEINNRSSFYPEAGIVFTVDSTEEHYHVPLLLSGYGYSTYRGS